MERQYAKCDITLVKPIPSQFKVIPICEDDNSKLLRSNSIMTNADYRKYMISKSTIINERNTKEYSKSL